MDLRFTVVDKDKAAIVLHEAHSLPELLVAGTGAVLRAPQANAHKLNLVDGGRYFLLFPNSGGVVQAGTGVSVVVDGIRLEPIDSPELTGATDASDRRLVLGVVLLAATVPVAASGASPAGSGTRRIGAPAGILTAAGAPAPLGAPAGMRTVIVTMRSQADLGAIPGGDHAARRQGIIRALQAHAANSQRALLRYLDGERALGHVAGDISFWVFNGLSVTATEEVIAALAARADVASVTSDATGIVPLAKPEADTDACSDPDADPDADADPDSDPDADPDPDADACPDPDTDTPA